jgi:hypothetical protein
METGTRLLVNHREMLLAVLEWFQMRSSADVDAGTMLGVGDGPA